jgi:hypothetical protein
MLHTGAVTGYIPRPYRRAIHNVEKTLDLLDRSHDAVTAHLRRLSILRAKVVAKYRALRRNFGVVAAPPMDSHIVVPMQTRRLLKRYYATGLAETGAETNEAVEHEEEADEEEPQASFLESAESVSADADAEVAEDAEAEEDTGVDADAEDEDAEEPAFMEVDEDMFFDEPLN